MSPVHNPGPTFSAPARLWSLDVLRGLCAGIVFLSHWHLWSDFSPHGPLERLLRRAGDAAHDAVGLLTWPTGGHHPAVIGFFVLSGFCIHYPYERRALLGEKAPTWPQYFWRRFLRIMPVYWAACALGLAFVVAERLQPTGYPLLQLHAVATTEDIVVRFAALASIYPREIFAGNYILTTVTVEIIMYAAYPLVYACARRNQWRALGVAFFAFHLLSIWLLRFFTPYWVFNSIFMLGLFWYAGAWAAHLFLTRRPRVAGASLLATWVVFLALKATPHFAGLNLLKQAAWGIVCAVGILWCLQWEHRHARWSETRLVRGLCKLGEVSYSLYAMHTPAMMLATWALIHLGHRRYLTQLTATMVASIAATLVVHYGIERVFYRRRSPAAASDIRYPDRVSSNSTAG